MANIQVAKYPIVFRILNGYLLASSPDFDIFVTKRFDDVNKMSDIGALYFDLLKKIEAEINKRIRSQDLIPKPTDPKHIDGVRLQETLTISEVARLLSISENSVRRLSEKKIIRSTRTPGGHRRFLKKDVDRYLKKLNLAFETPSLEESPSVEKIGSSGLIPSSKER